MTDFQRQVLADLATLKAQMRTLLGNGQPGRLREIEPAWKSTKPWSIAPAASERWWPLCSRCCTWGSNT